jgi:hypothetical protein
VKCWLWYGMERREERGMGRRDYIGVWECSLGCDAQARGWCLFVAVPKQWPLYHGVMRRFTGGGCLDHLGITAESHRLGLGTWDVVSPQSTEARRCMRSVVE